VNSIVSHKLILVTGGAGFIGSNLCEALLAEHNTVICYDNLATGRLENIELLKANDRFSFIEGDINDQIKLTEAMKSVDIVFHQAALGSVPRSINDPKTTNKVNVDGFLTLLESAKTAQVKRIVYASSSSVYGDTQVSPKVESTTGALLSPYAVSKYSNELYAGVFHKVYGIEIIGLRYFNVFGRRQRPDGAYAAAIPKFIDAFIQGKAPEIYGDGMQTRDFTYIDNVILANKLAANAPAKTASGEVFNVACGNSVSLNNVISEVKRLLIEHGKDVSAITPHYKAPRLGDVRSSLASIDKSNSILGYTPKYTFSEGLEQAIEWYVKALS